MAYPPVVVVDEHDSVVGKEMLAKVWEKGLYHRIAYVIVEDESGRVLLQRRSANMQLFPNRWDDSAAGHVDDGDTYESAAKREAEEELGLTGVTLEEVITYRTNDEFEGRKLNRFNRVYRARVPSDTQFHAPEDEVSELRWFTLDEVRKLWAEHPEQLTDGLMRNLEYCYPA
jgi:16S rRNA (adenine1518-N6/adenine1519-N6)-dimethyltransferase